MSTLRLAAKRWGLPLVRAQIEALGLNVHFDKLSVLSRSLHSRP